MTTQQIFAADHGHHFHFLNHLATVKVAAGDSGALSAVEFLAPRGFGPPLHSHDTEDELFIVLDGQVAFSSGDTSVEGGAGATVFLPHGEAHTFQVLSDTARFTTVTASLTGPPRFDQLVAALGVATTIPEIPQPSPIDPAHVADVCRSYGIQVLGPPPADLEATVPSTRRENT